MTAPKDPGHPGKAAGKAPEQAGAPPSGPGGADRGRPGRITDSGDPPPWQRAQAAQAAPAGGRPPEPARSPGVDERVRRFVSGTPAPTPAPTAQPAAPAAPPAAAPPAKQPAKPAQPEQPAGEVYGSELPDLSGARPARAAVPERRVQVARKAAPGPLRASMQIRRIDPWSALKVSLLLSTALFFVWMMAVAILYLLLGAMGVWSKLNSNFGELMNNGNSAAEMVSGGSVFGAATLIGLVNIVVLTAMATLGAVIYNLSTDVVGGVEVTLADRD